MNHHEIPATKTTDHEKVVKENKAQLERILQKDTHELPYASISFRLIDEAEDSTHYGILKYVGVVRGVLCAVVSGHEAWKHELDEKTGEPACSVRTYFRQNADYIPVEGMSSIEKTDTATR
jgi:hypothetical protein